MSKYHFYPKELFSINETRTRQNIANYERFMDKYYEVLHTEYPNLDSLPIRERWKIQDAVKERLNLEGYGY